MISTLNSLPAAFRCLAFNFNQSKFKLNYQRFNIKINFYRGRFDFALIFVCSRDLGTCPHPAWHPGMAARGFPTKMRPAKFLFIVAYLQITPHETSRRVAIDQLHARLSPCTERQC